MKNKKYLYLGIAALAGLAAGLLLAGKRKTYHDKPPRKAPKLHIDNPGDQSEFTTSATSEAELG